MSIFSFFAEQNTLSHLGYSMLSYGAIGLAIIICAVLIFAMHMGLENYKLLAACALAVGLFGELFLPVKLLVDPPSFQSILVLGANYSDLSARQIQAATDALLWVRIIIFALTIIAAIILYQVFFKRRGY
jgi:hypothetical protein